MRATAARVARYRGKEVHAHCPLELLVARTEKSVQAQPHAAHVVHQDVDAPVHLHGVRHQALRTIRRRQINWEGSDTRHSDQRLNGTRAGDHLGALVDQHSGDGEADAL
jgi:hypothetical protein